MHKISLPMWRNLCLYGTSYASHLYYDPRWLANLSTILFKKITTNTSKLSCIFSKKSDNQLYWLSLFFAYGNLHAFSYEKACKFLMQVRRYILLYWTLKLYCILYWIVFISINDVYNLVPTQSSKQCTAFDLQFTDISLDCCHFSGTVPYWLVLRVRYHKNSIKKFWT